MAHCCICENSWSTFRVYRGRSALCPGCKSLERHRSLFHVLKKLKLYPSDVSQRTLLSVSVDYPYFNKLKKCYAVTAIDRGGGRGILRANVMNLTFSDKLFDVVVQSHCIEHVSDDTKATFEIARVMKDTGLYVSCVPIVDKHVIHEKLFPPNHHYRDYSVESYRALLQKAFSLVEVYDLSNESDLGTYVFSAQKALKT